MKLHRNISVLLRRIALVLVTSHLESLNKTDTSVTRLDNLVNITELCCWKRICELLAIFLNLLVTLLSSSLTIENVTSPFCTHNGNPSCWVCKGHISTYAL